VRNIRVYTNQPLTNDSQIVLEQSASHHLSQVLRLKREDSVKLFNGNGNEFSGKITQLTKRSVAIELGALLRTEPEAPIDVHLLIGISRAERMDYALQKSVELGVAEIQPIFTQRCMVKLTGKRIDQRMAHWNKIVINACEQSGRCRLPKLQQPCWLRESLGNIPSCSALILHPFSDKSLMNIDPPDGAVSILVGPEGGLTEEESTLAKQSGCTPVRLGPRVLRTETAPLAAIAAIQMLWGDFR
jgi:16S rRNA (uracil1498-N3)-methyltransferase